MGGAGARGWRSEEINSFFFQLSTGYFLERTRGGLELGWGLNQVLMLSRLLFVVVTKGNDLFRTHDISFLRGVVMCLKTIRG